MCLRPEPGLIFCAVLCHKLTNYFLNNRWLSVLLILLLIGGGWMAMPLGQHPRHSFFAPVSIDAIPNLGDNQQIVSTAWAGQSPQDVQDYITYPLTTHLLGISGVKAVRSTSMFGFSRIYLIFHDSADFYESRTRIVERLAALPPRLLPEKAHPSLGPDATALGQVYAYTLEARDEKGLRVAGGWDLHEMRRVQDFYVKYALSAVPGVSEVASVGGYVQEYQVTVDAAALRDYGIPLPELLRAVQASNEEVGAKTIEHNGVEYIVRGLGAVRCLEDIEQAVVAIHHGLPIRIKDLAKVSLGPAERRGLLDKNGEEAVGGIVVARYGSNPMEVIHAIKKQVGLLAPGLPTKRLADGSKSRLTIVPFYDRSLLIRENVGTLQRTLFLELLITLLVVVVMLQDMRASLVVSSMLPLAVLAVFLVMRAANVEANVMALSGLAIAVGTIVDLGIVLTENILKHAKRTASPKQLLLAIRKAIAEVHGALMTASATTLVSFLPIFALQDAEGKLFRPLALTKTLVLVLSLGVVLLILPSVAYWLFAGRGNSLKGRKIPSIALFLVGLTATYYHIGGGIVAMLLAVSYLLSPHLSKKNPLFRHMPWLVASLSIVWLLTTHWLPLGASPPFSLNFIFVALLVAAILLFYLLLSRYYARILPYFLAHKKAFLLGVVFFVLGGIVSGVGFPKVFGFAAHGLHRLNIAVQNTTLWAGLSQTFPGLDKAFMPTLDEGSFLFMPSATPHVGVEKSKEILQYLDEQTANIPEVAYVVGKAGRADSALDPAPIAMYENIIQYKPEYLLDDEGRRKRFRVDENKDFLLRTGEALSNREVVNRGLSTALLIEDASGQYFRNWRAHIRTPDDIWEEIVACTEHPGVRTAPKLQPIATRLLMLQTGVPATVAIKVLGTDLQAIEAFGNRLEAILKEAPAVNPAMVFAERIMTKPYLHLQVKREALWQHGLSVAQLQTFIAAAVGGAVVSSVSEGGEQFAVRVRYPRALRSDPEALKKLWVQTPTGGAPLGVLVHLHYARGPHAIKSEGSFLAKHVLLDRQSGYTATAMVEAVKRFLQEKIDQGTLTVPAGVFYEFTGNYKNQLRAEKRMAIILPLAVLIIFAILCLRFRSLSASCMVLSGVSFSLSGAFFMLWLYNQGWFADFYFLNTHMRTLFQVHPVPLSVAVWVGCLVLFGIATDDGVLMLTRLRAAGAEPHDDTTTLRKRVVTAASQRIRPAAMTSATTLITLLPVLSSVGKGAEIMLPMSLPLFGGMLANVLSCFVVPVLYCLREEWRIKKS